MLFSFALKNTIDPLRWDRHRSHDGARRWITLFSFFGNPMTICLTSRPGRRLNEGEGKTQNKMKRGSGRPVFTPFLSSSTFVHALKDEKLSSGLLFVVHVKLVLDSWVLPTIDLTTTSLTRTLLWPLQSDELTRIIAAELYSNDDKRREGDISVPSSELP